MTGPNGRDWAPPPRFLTALSVAVLGVAAVLAVIGAFRVGVTTDEPIHVMRLRNYFDTGWYALDWDYRGEGPGSDGTNTFVYAPVAMLLLHAWSVLWGVEGWGDVATSAQAYDIRHLGVVVIGFVGVAAIVVIGRIILRHWRWGLVAGAALVSIPMWAGHEMMNVKDIPVATGYTLVTLGLVLFVRYEHPRIGARVARALVLASGLILSMGTRPGMWPGILAVLLAGVVAGLAASADNRQRLIGLAELAVSGTVAALTLTVVYPNLFANPFRSFPRTGESSSSFVDGEKSDRFYVPRHVLQEMPTILLFFVLTGAVIGALLIIKHHRTAPVPAGRIALVGVQTAAVPVAAILMGSDLYHGLRQLLFATPTAALLGAYGIAWWLHRDTGTEAVRRRRTRVVSLAAGAALVLPMIDQATLFPYQTTYVNLASDLVKPFNGPTQRPGSDYWRASLPELVEGVTIPDQMLCKTKVNADANYAFRFTNNGEIFSTNRSLDCREEPNGPLAPFRLTVPRKVGPTFETVFVGRMPENCTKVRDVRRWRHGFPVTLTLLARCTVEPPLLTRELVSTASPALGSAEPGDIWNYAIGGWEQWPGDTTLDAKVPVAHLGFIPDAGCIAQGCELVLNGTGPADLIARIGKRPVPVVVEDDGTIRLQISRSDADRKGIWISLSRRSHETLGVTISGLRLAPQAPDLSPQEGQE